MKQLLPILLAAASHLVIAQSASEIYLFDINTTTLKLTNGTNITRHTGYDNQPFFHPTKPVLYYASFDGEGRSDIKFYDYQAGKTNNLTSTPEREYSPTPTPDGKYISCIIQRDNGAQDLGKYPMEGGEAIVLIDDLIVGYHTWVNEKSLVLFVLGEPPTLRWYDLPTKTDSVLQSHIGRSLHKVPGKNAISFVHKPAGEAWPIMQFDYNSRKVSTLVPTLPGREDLCWTPDGKILMSDGGKILVYDPKNPAAQWQVLAMDSNIREITRLAISADGQKLAVVAAE